MLHYFLNRDISFECPPEILDDAKRLESMRQILGNHSIHLGLDGKVKIEVRPFPDGFLAVNFFGLRRGSWLPLRRQTIAVSEESASSGWRMTEENYKFVGDLPGFRSLDLPAPQQPENVPWSAIIQFFTWPGDEEFEQFTEGLDTTHCYIAQAWYERFIFGPPEDASPVNRCY